MKMRIRNINKIKIKNIESKKITENNSGIKNIIVESTKNDE
jgi:hypothetical protein